MIYQKDKRPCKRCATLGLECFDVPSKKRGRKRKFVGNTSTNEQSPIIILSNQPQQQVMHIQPKPVIATTNLRPIAPLKEKPSKAKSQPILPPPSQPMQFVNNFKPISPKPMMQMPSQQVQQPKAGVCPFGHKSANNNKTSSNNNNTTPIIPTPQYALPHHPHQIPQQTIIPVGYQHPTMNPNTIGKVCPFSGRTFSNVHHVFPPSNNHNNHSYQPPVSCPFPSSSSNINAENIPKRVKTMEIPPDNLRLAPLMPHIENETRSLEETDVRTTKIELLRKWLSTSDIKPSSKFEDGKAYIIHKLMTDDDVNYQFWALLDAYISFCITRLQKGLPIEDSTKVKPHKEAIDQLESLYLSIGVSKCPFLILRKEETEKPLIPTPPRLERLPSISRLALPGLKTIFNTEPTAQSSNFKLHNTESPFTKCPVGYHSISSEIEDMNRASGSMPPRSDIHKVSTVSEDGKFSEATETYIKGILNLCGAPILVYSLDFGGRLLLWNSKANETLGYETAPLGMLKFDDLLHISSENKTYLPSQTTPSTLAYNCNFVISHGTTKQPLPISTQTTGFLKERFSVTSM